MKKIIILIACLLPIVAHAADPVLKPGDFLAICGDSITEQKQYSVFIEDYLLACKPVSNISAMQFGWSGERADGFLGRMDNEVLRFKPKVATTCYGMNDGRYTRINDDIANAYRSNMERVVESFTLNGTRVVVGSPGCVDSTTFRRPGVSSEDYNKNLATLRDIAREIAQKRNLPFADVFQAMFDTMAKAKAKYGTNYHIAGGDGIHPAANGQLIMAYAFLKALGADGEIGTIKADFAAKKADGSDGHSVKSFSDDGVITIESTRYPFCFLPDKQRPDDLSSPNSTRGIIEFFPFNEELNRYTLIVNGITGTAKITWGDQTKEFTGEQLGKGINLAAEFLDNPFVGPFTKVHEAVLKQQNFETPFVKGLLHNMPQYRQILPEKEATFNDLVDGGIQKDKALFEAAAATVTPVTHTIRIEVIK